MCAFNYRFFPALRKAQEIIAAGDLGEIHHYRAQFLLSGALSESRQRTWRDDRATAGSGALGDLGSHHIDLSRYLLEADPARVSGLTRVVVPTVSSGQAIETDDLYAALIEYSNGAVGVLEASRVAGGHLVTSRVEVDGSKGSLQFSMQELNTLRVAGRDHAFKAYHVIDNGDPYQANWFPAGHPLGWVDTFSHEAVHILGAIAGVHDVAPHGATFADGYRCAEAIEAIIRSAAEGRATDVAYRGLGG
jgi:predicted dehydrogenase